MSDKKYPHNITREHLANTYGKCESQEHADFICKLAENAGFNVKNYCDEGCQWFCFNNYRVEFYSEEVAKDGNEKLIHLPLPNENEMESQLPTAISETEMPEVKPTKPIYTKEMHERGEFKISMIYLNEDSQKCELAGISHNKFIGNLVETPAPKYHLDISLIEDCKPILTIEDELTHFLDKTAGLTHGERVIQLLEKYNITPKGE